MQIDPNFTKFLSRHEIDSLIEKMAQELSKDYEGKDVVFISVLKGAFLFTADLIRHVTFNPEVDFVRLTRHKQSHEKSGTIGIAKDISINLKDKHVLIVEQILDSGRALKFLYNRIKAAEPASVEVATLLDKKNKRVVDVPVKYVGKTIDDHFLVGYGLDLEERCRNFIDLYYLRYPN